MSPSRLKPVLAYGTAVLLCLGALASVLEIWNHDVRIPFIYQLDGLLTLAWIKGIIENGWYLHNDHIGLPAGLDMRDFPMADNLHFLIIKLLGLFVADAGLVYNLYFILTFPATVVTSLYVLRHFGVSFPSGILASLLFSFLPYHFIRTVISGHLFLASYYLIPLATMVVLWTYLDRGPFCRWDDERQAARWTCLGGRALGSLLICALMASAGVYYALFFCFFLVIAGVTCSFSRGRAYPFASAGVLILFTGLALVVNTAPSILAAWEQGPNPDSVRRPAIEAETFGMKITQLLLPICDHRVGAFAKLKNRYYQDRTPLLNENDSSSLGLVGSFGFLLLAGYLLYRKPPEARSPLLDGLSLLNVFALLVGTIGGFGSMVSILGFTLIRGYNRISIFVAFFSLFAVALALDRLAIRCAKPRWQSLFLSFLGLLFVGGVLDQTGAYVLPRYQWLREQYTHDAEFIHSLEARLPAGARVFQLPYRPFPEAPRLNQMPDYELFRAYLHSQHLNWSYGTMRGRMGDRWQKAVTDRPTDELVRYLCFSGFSGIYVDRLGYADLGREREATLAAVLQTKPLVSPNERLAFFDMTEYLKGLREQYTESGWRMQCQAALHPVVCTWGKGFRYQEGSTAEHWRWCADQGELEISNFGERSKHVSLRAFCCTNYEETAHVRIESPWFQDDLPINVHGTFWTQAVTVPPGTHRIKFSCDARRVDVPWAVLVFRLVNFSLNDLTAQAATESASPVSPGQHAAP